MKIHNASFFQHTVISVLLLGVHGMCEVINRKAISIAIY